MDMRRHGMHAVSVQVREKKQQKNKDWERLTWTIVCLLSVSGISPCHTGPDLRLYPGNGVKSFQ